MRKLIGALALVAMLFPIIAVLTASAQVPQESDFDTWVFARTWARTDLAVAEGKVSRTWMWGPGPETRHLSEDYVEAPNGERNVQYFDKSRMEEMTWRTTEEPWDVTNGLLATELITGRMQLGDNTFQQYCPSTVNIAGDPVPVNPTYATFSKLILAPAHGNGSVITATVDKTGNVGDEQSVSRYGVKAVSVGAPTGHNVASVFWEFMNNSGLVFNANIGEYQENQKLFINPFYATGYPITEAYWSEVVVAGTLKPVLTQAFERRVLTYTPDNPHGWQVEAGNVGLHYYQWRHEGVGLTDCSGDGHGPDPVPPVHEPKPPVASAPQACNFPTPGDIGKMDSRHIEKFESNTWSHRVFNEKDFVAPDWDGADSWYVTLALGPNSGGFWTDHGKFSSGEIVYRGTDNHIQWCLGVLTTSHWNGQNLLDQFLDGAEGPAAINVRIAPNSMVTVVTATGKVVSQTTSDMGDITIILPSDGVVTISVSYTTKAPTHESLVWWGPYDRSEHINTIDAR